MGSHFAQNTTPTPVLYSAVTNLFWGYVRTQNTPGPPQNTHFPGKWAKSTTVWAKWIPTGQNV